MDELASIYCAPASSPTTPCRPDLHRKCGRSIFEPAVTVSLRCQQNLGKFVPSPPLVRGHLARHGVFDKHRLSNSGAISRSIIMGHVRQGSQNQVQRPCFSFRIPHSGYPQRRDSSQCSNQQRSRASLSRCNEGCGPEEPKPAHFRVSGRDFLHALRTRPYRSDY
jgi:hypothetical protein